MIIENIGLWGNSLFRLCQEHDESSVFDFIGVMCEVYKERAKFYIDSMVNCSYLWSHYLEGFDECTIEEPDPNITRLFSCYCAAVQLVDEQVHHGKLQKKERSQSIHKIFHHYQSQENRL